MTEIDDKLKGLRALLTETLPYELPIGFTNEFLFLSELKAANLSEATKLRLKKIRYSSGGHTKPFLYRINKSNRSKNTLGITHPKSQIELSEFISDFEQSIIQACGKSPFSIRRPANVQKIVANNATKDVRRRWALILPETEPKDGLGVSYSSSYFGYLKYLLIDKFFSSNELIRLEGKFQRMRSLDVSRCFFNIYTHSICWAVKEKDFSKRHVGEYSFEQRFDRLMQLSNYNETAGIIVGPEVSRIFAEIILQRVDVEIENRITKNWRLVNGTDYTIRRYVDDFYIFSNDDENLNRIESVISEVLETYKLFLNQDKAKDSDRPFVNSTSRVKHELSRICSEIFRSLTEALSDGEADVDRDSFVYPGVRNAFDALRHIGGSERASLASSTAGVYTALHSGVRRLAASRVVDLNEAQQEDLSNRLRNVIRILFYLVSLDFRVPPILRASQIIKEVIGASARLQRHDQEALTAYIIYEISELIDANYREEGHCLDLEILNIFIVGLMVNGRMFLSQPAVENLLVHVLSGKKNCYFSVLCALHSLAKTSALSNDQKNFILDFSIKIRASNFDLYSDSEKYLMFVDFISCPHIDVDFRWEVCNEKLGGNIMGKEDFLEFLSCISHTKWRDDGVDFTLVQRRLPPVYASV